MNTDLLRKAGLSEGEIKVYQALLDLGSTSTNKIHERTGIERRNIYDILNKLIERGLVTYIDENKRRTFQLAHPKALIGYLEEKKKHIESIEQDILKELPQIINKFESKKPEIRAEIFRGAEGIKAVWEDMLNYKEIRWLGSGYYVPHQFPAFFKQWNKRRQERKIFTMHLFREDKRNIVSKRDFPHGKFLPSEFNGNPTVTVIFGNKVAQFLFGENLFAFVIDSKELAENYLAYHKYLWNNVAKK
ncbi:MAG: helix-turn-helix domain-containing protein [Nanoarchaeota archaeon]|mgnify:CR=1 FL=1